MGGGVGGGEGGGGGVVVGTFWKRAQNTEGIGVAVRATESAVESKEIAMVSVAICSVSAKLSATSPMSDYGASPTRKVTLSLNEDAEKLCCFL